jgi:hypothetical protein
VDFLDLEDPSPLRIKVAGQTGFGNFFLARAADKAGLNLISGDNFR